MDDIPFAVTDRPIPVELSPDAEREFLLKQAEYEAAHRRTGDPDALFRALAHVWWARQTVPGWLVPAIGEVLIRNTTAEEAERYRERMRHVRRYIVVRDLRAGKKHTKDEALDLAVVMLRGEPAAGLRLTIERSYDVVRRDLERAGRESEYFLLVALIDETIPRSWGTDR